MIHKVYSDLLTFKELTFNPGLNILLAVKTPGASNQQTRNSAGKSSLTDIFHFLLGSSCGPDSIFRNEDLIDSSFGLIFDLGGAPVDVSRSGSKPSKILVNSAETDKWVNKPKISKKTKEAIISNTNWVEVLGETWFDVSTFEDDEEASSAVSFRQLISYYIRRQSSGGFEDPFKFFGNQFPVSIQSCMFYFLDLDQFLPQKWNHVREREKTIKELKGAMSKGLYKDIVQSTSNLRTQIALSEKQISEMDLQLKDYKVLPQYRSIEEDANSLIAKISGYSNQDTIDLQLLGELELSLKELPPPDIEQVESVYKEAGIVFPESVTKRLDEVIEFHKSVYENRKNYLESDIKAIKEKTAERGRLKSIAEGKYSESMKLLQSHGALDVHIRLTTKRDEAKLKLSALKDQFDVALSLETNKSSLEGERADLMSQLVAEFRERKETINEAIVLFESISSKLYEQAGSLHLGESLNGPTFDISIQGEKSKGINNMQVFCLDMTLTILTKTKGKGPGFLVHDSHIFDGVDERQVAKALELGKKLAQDNGFQYIVTMNSDTFNGVIKNIEKSEDIKASVLPTVLTDETDTGGLFGFRFN